MVLETYYVMRAWGGGDEGDSKATFYRLEGLAGQLMVVSLGLGIEPPGLDLLTNLL